MYVLCTYCSTLCCTYCGARAHCRAGFKLRSCNCVVYILRSIYTYSSMIMTSFTDSSMECIQESTINSPNIYSWLQSCNQGQNMTMVDHIIADKLKTVLTTIYLLSRKNLCKRSLIGISISSGDPLGVAPEILSDELFQVPNTFWVQHLPNFKNMKPPSGYFNAPQKNIESMLTRSKTRRITSFASP